MNSFAWCHAITSKGTGLQSPALSLLKSLPGFLSLRFSHRFQRIAKAQLILYQPSADGLGAIAVNSYMLCKWPLLILCATMVRIQRGQEVDTRWTAQPPHALVAQNSPNRFQRIRLRQNSCAPIRDKFAFVKFCYFFSHSSFSEVLYTLWFISVSFIL